MPELPEVESFALALKREYAGKRLSEFRLHRKDLRFPFDKPVLERIFSRGSVLLEPYRIAKQLVLSTENGMVAVSLGMSGSFIPSSFPKIALHEHVTLIFEDGSALAYVDPRRFGFWKPFVAASEISTAADPLQEESLLEIFSCKKFTDSERSVKDALMDQNLIGGIGNIYAVEALFRAGVSPLRKCSRVKHNEYRKLSEIIPRMLTQAIDAGGSTVSTYRRLHGESGGFQELHLVYDREGERCSNQRCKGIIRRATQTGRSSWWCPRCQK
ncbi:MAG: bifunctional DNA-formamidopyrimidine glycosylase/DNA-(apurinic or apyrimidinic site) lyase [Proteobacteria bacterium]|nr:bifunctional DNA-formamidopyrimidine glycosylase/DNA-(apurinic or apyrimidinic site) lyase [Pseudomonadota bacterium]